ncbi:hypothetical protein SEPCBS119000_000467 [Sporothrix epigloea]|uniref:Uncharacterized protein n=1 Tax=Sporothrix epigloea TaxID=1892477 RepID=A0ABP0D5C5_9PEZI
MAEKRPLLLSTPMAESSGWSGVCFEEDSTAQPAHLQDEWPPAEKSVGEPWWAGVQDAKEWLLACGEEFDNGADESAAAV